MARSNPVYPYSSALNLEISTLNHEISRFSPISALFQSYFSPRRPYSSHKISGSQNFESSPHQPQRNFSRYTRPSTLYRRLRYGADCGAGLRAVGRFSSSSRRSKSSKTTVRHILRHPTGGVRFTRGFWPFLTILGSISVYLVVFGAKNDPETFKNSQNPVGK